MDARLLGQLAHVFDREVASLRRDPYAWPPAPEVPASDTVEADRLAEIADAIFMRARIAGFGQDGKGNGSNAAFG